MIEINCYTDIDKVLKQMDHAATEALNHNKVLYVEWGTDRKMTDAQRGALHVWCDQYATTLNDAGFLRKRVKLNGDLVEEDWNKITFKEDVYKVMLKALTMKTSTEKQSTIEPSDVANHINRHFSQTRGISVPWPSRR